MIDVKSWKYILPLSVKDYLRFKSTLKKCHKGDLWEVVAHNLKTIGDSHISPMFVNDILRDEIYGGPDEWIERARNENSIPHEFPLRMSYESKIVKDYSFNLFGIVKRIKDSTEQSIEEFERTHVQPYYYIPEVKYMLKDILQTAKTYLDYTIAPPKPAPAPLVAPPKKREVPLEAQPEAHEEELPQRGLWNSVRNFGRTCVGALCPGRPPRAPAASQSLAAMAPRRSQRASSVTRTRGGSRRTRKTMKRRRTK